MSSNFEYEFEMPPANWIKTADTTRGMSSHTIKFEVSPNESYDNRDTNIRFYDPNSNISESVKIIQAQKDAIIISENVYNVDSNLNYIAVEVNANVEFDVVIPDDFSSWIRLADNPLTRALKPGTLDFVISENTTFDKRHAKIFLKSGGVESSVYLIQYGQPIDLSANGTANCYIVPLQDTYFSLDASVAGNDKTYLLKGGVKTTIVWEDSFNSNKKNLIEKLEYNADTGRIKFKTATKSFGNILIGLQDENEKIIWSWHLWLTDYNPEDKYVIFSDGAILMDRYLGAYSEDSRGLYYQWGRKDPFSYRHQYINTYEENPITLDFCNSHPNTFIGGGYDTTLWDWNNEHTATWSSTKSVYDPCPPGWKVMDNTCLPSSYEGEVDEENNCFILGEPYCKPITKFKYTGLLHSAGHIQGTTEHVAIWTNLGSYHGFYTAYSKNIAYNYDLSFRGDAGGRAYGHCIRCQKE